MRGSDLFISIPLIIARSSPNVLPLTILAQFMNPTQTTPPKGISSRLTTPLVRWSLAIILICGFGLLNATPEVAKSLDIVGTSSLGKHAEIDLFTHSETLTAAKRFNASGKDQSADGDTSPLWLALKIAEDKFYQVVDTRQQLRVSETIQRVKNHSLQQLNVPRAPPLA